jgi:hypothetical protein
MTSVTFPLRIVLGVVALIAVALGCWILFRFDPAKGYGFPLCFFHAFTGLNCPGCGSLRASHQLLHGNLLEAIRCNALFVLSLPLAGLLGFHAYFRRGAYPPARVTVRVAWLGFIILLAFSILRNVSGPLRVALSP